MGSGITKKNRSTCAQLNYGFVSRNNFCFRRAEMGFQSIDPRLMNCPPTMRTFGRSFQRVYHQTFQSVCGIENFNSTLKFFNRHFKYPNMHITHVCIVVVQCLLNHGPFERFPICLFLGNVSIYRCFSTFY